MRGMRVHVIAPSPALAPYLRALTIVETGPHEEVTRTLVPEAGMVLGLRYRGASWVYKEGGATRMPDAVLTGVSTVARRMRTAADSGIVLAMFREGAAAQFFEQPQHELHSKAIALDELVPLTELQHAAQRVADAEDAAARAAALEAFLLSRLRTNTKDLLVTRALRSIAAARGAIRVASLAADLGLGMDRLEKRFRSVVGATPKQLATIYRVRNAIQRYKPGMLLTELAVELGYCDQSHFIREVRAALGEPPGRFFNRVEFC